jgi:hypothetical protein
MEEYMKEYKDLYIEINHKQAVVIDTSLHGTNKEIFAKSHLFLSDLEKWMKYLSSNSEALLYKTAIEEYANCLFLITCGLYRQSYITLRFFLEHVLFGLYLSVNELNFRRWSMNKYDMHWAEITDIEKGVFCKDYFEAYSPEFTEYSLELLNICKQLYRELSEYTHGNLLATQTLPAEIIFNEEIFIDINQKIDSIRHLITFLFFIRYKNILSNKAVHDLENPIMDVIGNYPEVQAFFALEKESDI